MYISLEDIVIALACAFVLYATWAYYTPGGRS